MLASSYQFLRNAFFLINDLLSCSSKDESPLETDLIRNDTSKDTGENHATIKNRISGPGDNIHQFPQHADIHTVTSCRTLRGTASADPQHRLTTWHCRDL